MDEQRAYALLRAERVRVEELLARSVAAGDDDREAENAEIAVSDAAEPLIAEGVEDAVEEGLRERLAALDRAELRLQAGTYGRSVVSGEPIPDARLEANPAAEVTVEEARR